MMYTTHLVQDDKDFFWCVFEKRTKQAIDFFYFKEDAEKYAQFLNSGGAFDGFTPAFMLVPATLPLESRNLDGNFEKMQLTGTNE